MLILRSGKSKIEEVYNLTRWYTLMQKEASYQRKSQFQIAIDIVVSSVQKEGVYFD